MPPDFNNITADDLSDNERLKALYLEAIRRKLWPNNPRAALDFFCFAEKALHDDKQGSPGKLFYALIKRGDTTFITQKCESRALLRLPSSVRQELVDTAGDLNGLAAPVPEDVQQALFGRDIGYCHGIMMQCFLPQKALPEGRRNWQVSHGRASMLVEAGRVIEPEVEHSFRHCDVPSGSKARFIIPYIIGYAVQHGTRDIDLGRSLRQFMAKIGMPIAGRNGKFLAREVENVAAANFYLGGWDEEGGTTQFARVAQNLSFWVERTDNQFTIWQPQMILSGDFYDAIQHRRVPVDMAHLMQLGKSPRRMDLYCWFSYRLTRIQKGKRIPISLRYLQPIFAPDIADPYYFKQALKNDLKAIARVYSAFNLELEKDTLWLAQSPSPIPSNLVHLL